MFSTMSYEFHLANPEHAQQGSGETALELGPLDPAAEKRKEELASALIALNPQLEVFRLDYRAIAAAHGVSLDEARRRWRHLELTGPDEGNGIQIVLWDTHVTISVPFWHSGPEAVAVLEEIWEYMRLLNSLAGMRPFDPQLGRALDLDSDLTPVAARFSVGQAILNDTIDEESE